MQHPDFAGDGGPRPCMTPRHDPDDGDERRREVLDEAEWKRLEERLAINLANVMAGNLKWEDDDDDTETTALDSGLD